MSLTIAPEDRGRGWARPLIAALIHEARAAGATLCSAEIKVQNLRSLSAFLGEGFDGPPIRLTLTLGTARARERRAPLDLTAATVIWRGLALAIMTAMTMTTLFLGLLWLLP